MWGAGGGTGQAQNWGFSAQQYAQVSNEQEKWAALAHQWIQMKSSGGGLEQTLQPPLPDAAPPINNNGVGNSHTYNESEDYIGEAPMDLDDSVSQQNHLIQQSLLSMNAAVVANHQSLFTPDLTTQIPPNPSISFSSITPSSLSVQQSVHLQQQPTRVIPLLMQPFHHIQPQIPPAQQQPVGRLLQPSYLEQAKQSTAAHTTSSHSNNNKRRNRPQKPEHTEPIASFQSHQQTDYGYLAETTNSDMFEGIPRRSLPVWIREGLEKVEQEKRRLEQKEREAELREQKVAERRDQSLVDSDEDDSRDGVFNKQGYEMPKPYIHTALISEVQQAPLVSAMSKRGSSSSASGPAADTSQKASSLRRPKSPSLEELIEGMGEDDRLELAMGIVRRQLTSILLEVTTEEMRQVAKDSITRAKQKGLGGYESDSGSEGEGGGGPRTKFEGRAKSDSEDDSSSDDSEAELIAEIERKRLNFELQENEFTTSRFQKTTGRLKRAKSPTPTPAPELPKENRSRNSSESRSEPPAPVTPKTIPDVVTPPKVDQHSDRRTSSASEHESSRKSKRSKSPERDLQRKHRTRSRERKDNKRKSKSRSRSKEKGQKRRSKSKSRERERDRKRKSKSRSRSRSRDRKNQRWSRSKDRKKKRSRRSRTKSRSRSRSQSDSSRRRSHRRRSSSSHSSSRSPEKRKHKRHDKSKKKSHRSRSRSRSTSKSKSSRRSKSDKRRHDSRSKSPVISTSSRATSN